MMRVTGKQVVLIFLLQLFISSLLELVLMMRWKAGGALLCRAPATPSSLHRMEINAHSASSCGSRKLMKSSVWARWLMLIQHALVGVVDSKCVSAR
ncbi:hypothetical protein B0H63DRAFT_456760 [Podospora didyma]|uniref:Uncharacterized protein n=1 Tax=Podospora didyma TaxID=330526 RepID=A0AAE0P4L1_9PEZI|nr:hypothetical protein B0H63DRAFT_456760 [Podospora didyma]